MSRKLNWDALRFRKITRPLISDGDKKVFKQDALKLADRLAKGKKSANASRCGPVRQLSWDEIKNFAAERGLAVSRKIEG